MILLKKIILLFWGTLIVIGFVSNLRIQDANAALPSKIINFEHFTTRDGLSNPVVYDIKQDKNGFLWFATGNGLSKYNGYDFVNYFPDSKNPNAIGKGPILQLYVDQQKQLWVVAFSSGLFRYDEKNDNFIQYGHLPGNPNSLPSNKVYSITQDSSGIFWITTMGDGLTSYDETKDLFTHYLHEPEDLNSPSSDTMLAIFSDSKDNIWISTQKNGVDRYDPETKRFSHYLKNVPHAVGIIEDQFNDIWIPTLGGGVYRYIRKENQFVSYRYDENDPHSISHNQVIKVFEDHLGTIWLTTWGGGVNVYDRKNDNFIVYRNQTANPKSLSNNNTWGLFEDDTGVMWIGTYGAGINKYDRKKERFGLLRHDPTDPNSLRHNSVKTIYEDSQGFLWLGTLGGGLSRYNQATKTFQHFLHDPENPTSISHNNIWKVVEDKDHDLWIATENGLDQYDRSEDRLIHYKHDPDNLDSLGSNLIRTVYVDKQNRIWIGTQHEGFDRFDRQQNKFIHYKVAGAHNTVLFQDKSGVLWGANQDLFKYDEKKDLFQKIYLKPESGEEPIKGFFTIITEDADNNLWLGTTSGLNKFDRQKNSVRHYGVDDGLNDEAIADLLFDEKGHLWISTARGLSVLNPDSNSIRNYELGPYNRGAGFVGKTGTLFFGGLHGMTWFSIEDVTDNLHVPKIVLTSFKKFNKEVQLAEPLTQLANLDLTYEDRFFSFEFAALDFSDPDKNQYRYKLHGFDEDWIFVSSKRRFAAYTNLDAGEYVFQVSGTNNDGIWNEKGTSVKISITPPWWQSWWFYLVLTCALIMAVALFIMYLVRLKFEIRERKHAEHSLRISQEKYRELVEGTKDLITSVDSKGNFIFVNNRAKKFLGVSIDNCIGTSVFEFVHPDDIKQIKKWFQKRIKLRSSDGTIKYRQVNIRTNEIFTMLLTSNFHYDGNGNIKFIDSAARDITVRNRYEEGIKKIALEEPHKFGQQFFDSIVLKLFKTLEADYTYIGELTQNKKAIQTISLCVDGEIAENFQYHLLYTPCENVIGQSGISFKKDVAKLFPKDKRLNQMGLNGYVGVPLFDKTNKPTGIMVALYRNPVKDINFVESFLQLVASRAAAEMERTHVEKALRVSEKRYRHLFNNAPAGMFEVDFVKRKLIEVNEVLCKFTGYSEAEFLSIDPLTLLTEKSKKKLVEEYEITCNGGKVSNDIEYNIITKDEEKLCVVLNSDFIYEDEKLITARVVVHDITERKKIENMIIQSEKMMSVGGLAAGMAHEINNPLAGMMQNSQVVRNRLSQDMPANNRVAEELGTTMAVIREFMHKREILKQLDSINTAGVRAAKIIKNMLSFSRKSNYIKTKNKLDLLIDKTIELAKNDYDLKKLKIIREYCLDIPEILCEESKIQQVLFNIIKNASEAMNQNEQQNDPPMITLRLRKSSNMACIEIEDNGPGIDYETQKRIFEPFFTTKSADKGTGLGLSVSYFIIVDDHKGTMEVKSMLGKGTIFIIKLPIV